MSIIHPKSLYKGPSAPLLQEARHQYDYFDGFVEPWTERDVALAEPDSMTGIKAPIVILVHKNKRYRYRQGTYLTPEDRIRVASTRALSAVSDSGAPPNFFICAVSAAICRLKGYGESTWGRDWGLGGVDMDVLTRKMELILKGEVSVEYWWNLPLVKPIQIVNS